jgi:hypothetical protein
MTANNIDAECTSEGTDQLGKKCASSERILRAITVVSPPVIVSELSPVEMPERHLASLFKGLQETEYEFRIAKFEASEYGHVEPQGRVILIASKVGLPSPPGIYTFRKHY